jgi:hypothetical protein
MTDKEIGEIIAQVQTTLAEKLENILRQLKNQLEPQGKWTPELEEKLRQTIKLSN